jgi:hypothetical protein
VQSELNSKVTRMAGCHAALLAMQERPIRWCVQRGKSECVLVGKKVESQFWQAT